MIEIATSIGFVLLGAAMLLLLIRILRGPTLGDRILALDTMTLVGVGMIAVFAARTGFYLYLDVAIALGLVGFLSTVALARYLLTRRNQ